MRMTCLWYVVEYFTHVFAIDVRFENSAHHRVVPVFPATVAVAENGCARYGPQSIDALSNEYRVADPVEGYSVGFGFDDGRIATGLTALSTRTAPRVYEVQSH